MNIFGVLIVIIMFSGTTKGAELVKIPKGEIEAIWLSPMSKKTKQKSNKIILRLDSFQIQSHPVSVLDFKKFIIENPEWSKNSVSSLFKDDYYLNNFENATDLAPITYVTWFAARAYCHWLGLRLPNLNEWEYVAAASETKRDANRDPKFLERILKWYGEPQGQEMKNVGSIYKNKYGIWDLHGLIWEWVEDFNTNFVTGESREDGSYNKDMFCGAGAMSSTDKENYAAYMRFAFRSSLRGKSSVWNLGFRCAK